MTDLGAVDVLSQGSDRGPWRPSRRQRIAGVVALAGVLVAALVVARAHERALDRRAARAVDVLVGGLDESVDGPPYLLEVENAGAARVELQGVQLVGPGYARQRLATPLAAGEVLALRVSPGSSCDVRRYDAMPQAVRLTVRDPRGGVSTRTTPLPADAARSLEERERTRCGLERPGTAVSLGSSRAVWDGDLLLVEEVGSNVSRLPVAVALSGQFPGLRVLMPGPVTLRPADPSGGAAATTFRVTVRVTDCAVFARAVRRPDGVYGGAPVDAAVTLRNRFESFRTALDLRAGASSAPSPFDRLLEVCPQAAPRPLVTGADPYA